MYEIEKCKRMKMPMGVKVVRGAYLVEERNLANEFDYESPIAETFEETSVNIEANLRYLIDHIDVKYDELIIASHNKGTIRVV